jgi:hypothetical protein
MIMRDDMSKVIVERPRWGSRMRSRDGRLHRASEDVPAKIGMKQGHWVRKHFSENLAPLKRWLTSQVNRPWDKVYAEISEHIDRRNTVQDHIFTHIESFVDIRTRMIGGRVCVLDSYGQPAGTLESAGARLYVHPVTGLLLRNRHYMGWQKRRERDRESEKAKIESVRRYVGENELLMCLDGIWYFVVLAQPAAPIPVIADARESATRFRYPTHWDVVRKRSVTAYWDRGAYDSALRLYGNGHVYAKSKRQLSAKELKQYRLTNENAGETRRFSFRASNRGHSIRTILLARTGLHLAALVAQIRQRRLRRAPSAIALLDFLELRLVAGALPLPVANLFLLGRLGLRFSNTLGSLCILLRLRCRTSRLALTCGHTSRTL